MIALKLKKVWPLEFYNIFKLLQSYTWSGSIFHEAILQIFDNSIDRYSNKSSAKWLKRSRKMLRLSKLSAIYFSVFLQFLFIVTDNMYAQTTPPLQKNIMVLHGEWQMWKWGKPFDSTLYTEMTSQSDQDLRITFEFMGLESVEKGAYPQEIIEHLRYKTAKNPLDLVVAFLPQANEFLLSYGQEVFPGVPKIFVLPDGDAIDKINDLPGAVVIASSSDAAIKTNVDRIFSILPNTKELVVVCGNSPHDLTYLRRAKEVIATSEREISINYLVGEPLDQLLSKVSNLPKNAVILFLTYSKDTNNKKMVSAVAISQISDKANAPIFGFYDSLLGSGIVGGNLTSAGQYGRKTAELGLRLLRGEQVSSVPSVRDATIDIYDWRQLKRWNISEDRLPPESIIRYKRVTLWEAHKAKIILAILFVGFQTIFIFALIITLKRQRRIENDLRESERELQKHRDHLEVLVEERTIKIEKTHKLLMDSKALLDAAGKMANVGGWELDAETLEVKWTKQTYRIYELPFSHKPPLDDAINFFHPEDREKLSLAIQKALEHGEGYDMEVRLITAKGKNLWTRTACKPQIVDGKILKLKGTFQDITKQKEMALQQEKLITELQDALTEVRTLSGLLPICAACKKIRDDKGYWNQIESYVQKHSEAEFSHSMCPECSDKLYGDEDWYIEMKNNPGKD